MRECGDDLSGGGLADLAVAVVDAALRERERAAAAAGFSVEFVERDGFLLGRELGEIHAGKFAGAFGVLQKNLAGVLEGFHFDVANGQAEERTDFSFVENGIAQAFVLLNDAAFGIQDKRSGKRGDAAILNANVVGNEGDGIVDAEFLSELLDGVLIVIVNDEAENLKAVFVLILELDEVRNFRAAGSAPGGPKIQQDDFAVGIGEGDGFAVEPSELEVWRGIGIAHEADGGLVFLLSKGQNWNKGKQ